MTSEYRTLPAEPSARHHHELCIAESHARAAADPPIDDAKGQPHHHEANCRAEERVEKVERRAQRKRGQTKHGPAHRYRIRNVHVLEIDERHRHQGKREDQVGAEDRGHSP
jgi:hypothetical protein